MATRPDNGVLRTLARGLETGQLVSVHSNPDNPDACSVGRVDAIATSHVRLRSVTPTGHELGYEVRRLEDIYAVEEHSPYLSRMEALAARNGEVFSSVEAPPVGRRDDLVREVVELAMNARQVVTLFLHSGEEVGGRVAATTDLRVTLRAIDRFGEESGKPSIPWRDIKGVDYGTEEEQIRGFLAP